MDEKALDALRIGLEDSYWYSDDDEKVFNELVRKAKAFDEMKETAIEVLNDIYEREITHADLGYQSIGRELTVIIDNLEKEDYQ